MKYVVVYKKSATGWGAPMYPIYRPSLRRALRKRRPDGLFERLLSSILTGSGKLTYRFPSRAHQQKWSPFHKPAWDSRGATADSAEQSWSVTNTPPTATPKTALVGNQVLEVDVLLAIYVASVLELVRFRARHC